MIQNTHSSEPSLEPKGAPLPPVCLEDALKDPRKFYVLRKHLDPELKKGGIGWTDGCAGCQAMRVGKSGIAHEDHCRARVIESLKGNPQEAAKVKAAEERQNEWFTRKKEKEDKKAEEEQRRKSEIAQSADPSVASPDVVRDGAPPVVNQPAADATQPGGPPKRHRSSGVVAVARGSDPSSSSSSLSLPVKGQAEEGASRDRRVRQHPGAQIVPAGDDMDVDLAVPEVSGPVKRPAKEESSERSKTSRSDGGFHSSNAPSRPADAQLIPNEDPREFEQQRIGNGPLDLLTEVER